MSETGGLPRRLAGFSDLSVSPSGKAVFFRLNMQDGDSLTAGCAPKDAVLFAAHLISLAQQADSRDTTAPPAAAEPGDWVDAVTMEPTSVALADGRGPGEVAVVFTVGRLRFSFLCPTAGLARLLPDLQRLAAGQPFPQ
jgi:hypothetical protein